MRSTAKMRESQSAQPSKDRTNEGLGRVVLVVEDDEGIRRAIRSILERVGYTVFEAANGDMALSLCEQYKSPPDLLLTDLQMPIINGRELVEELARQGNAPKVLLMSALGDHGPAARPSFTSRYPFIQKPFSKNDLVEKIREILHVGGARLTQPRRHLNDGTEATT